MSGTTDQKILDKLKTTVTTLSEKIVTLKKAEPVDGDAVTATVKELLDAKKLFADANGGIGVDGNPYVPPMTKAEKKAKQRADKAAKATKEGGGGGGGGGKEKAAPDSAKALKKAAKKAEAQAKKAAVKSGTSTPAAANNNNNNIKKPPTNTQSSTKKRSARILPQTKLKPLELSFSPNAPLLTDRPIISLTIACLTNSIDDLTITSDHNRTSTGAVLGLPNGSELAGDAAIARYLARRPTLRRHQILGGDDPSTTATVDSWVDYALSQIRLPLSSRTAAVAATLETVLPSRTYLVGEQTTLADVAVFTALGFPTRAADALSTAASLAAYPHTLRWANMMRSHQSLREATQIAMSVSSDDDVVFDADAPPLTPLVTGMSPLDGATAGNVVTRFPPEPSGYLHVGHAKALLMNEYYARRYRGRLIVRFDDTNPSKEKEEYRESILEDLESLGVVPDVVTYTSDYFNAMREYALTLIHAGLAYMDDTPQEQMQQERMDHVHSRHRDQPISTTLEHFTVMSSSSPAGSTWCLRARIDMSSTNGTMRDPVLYRQNTTPHHRTGTAYSAYPTYDLACPIVDSIEGVTHALRTTEYDDRNEQYRWIQVALDLRRVRIHSFARMNFRHTVLSKRQLGWFVEEGLVTGWDDARFPTVRGVVRRGVNIKAMRGFICSQGASKNIVNMEWGRFWAENKKEIDLYAKRFMAIDIVEKVGLTVTNGPEGMEFLSTDLLPKDPSFGKRLVRIGKKVVLEKGDVEGITVGEEIVLMRWGKLYTSCVCMCMCAYLFVCFDCITFFSL